MSDSALVEIKALEKTFFRPGTQVEVLKEIDLIIQKGQTLAVVGASGVGKTTLLHLIGAINRGFFSYIRTGHPAGDLHQQHQAYGCY